MYSFLACLSFYFCILLLQLLVYYKHMRTNNNNNAIHICRFFCLFTHSKPDAVYEDPQLLDNPAYGTAGTAKGVKEEEPYETCFQ